jgi:hypothetical protein
VRPAGVEAETERFTVPVNELSAVTVIVDVPEPPAKIWTGLTEPAAIEKSGNAVTWNVMMAVACEREPLVPVTVTSKLFAVEALQDSVAVWGEVPRITLAAKVQVRPDGEDGDTERLTVPVNPFRAVTVIVCVPATPTVVLTVTGADGSTV